ncbi:MAG: hypothetical protein L0099_07245 [Acidobacteria bacterium]|nr:hypothetical protein [Acidobacteriota bacterium]
MADFGPGVGDVILQAAQGIIQQFHERNRLILQQKQFDEEVKARQRQFDIEQSNLALKAENFQLEQQRAAAKEQRDVELFPLRKELIEARTAQATAAAARAPGGVSIDTSLVRNLNASAAADEFSSRVQDAVAGQPGMRSEVVNFILGAGPRVFAADLEAKQRQLRDLMSEATRLATDPAEKKEALQGDQAVVDMQAEIEVYNHVLSKISDVLPRLASGVASDEFRQSAAQRLNIPAQVLSVIESNDLSGRQAEIQLFGTQPEEMRVKAVTDALNGDVSTLVSVAQSRSVGGSVPESVRDALERVIMERGVALGKSREEILAASDALDEELSK